MIDATPFSATEFVVYSYLMFLGMAASFCAIYSSKVFGPVTAVLVLGYGLFAYSTFPIFFSSSPRYWFEYPPPALVSRSALLVASVIFFSCIWRARKFLLELPPARILILVAFVAMPIALTLTSATLHPQVDQANDLIQLKFSIVCSFFLLLSVGFAAYFRTASASMSCHTHLYRDSLIIIGLVVFVAAMEVGLDLAPVKNFVRGQIENRASATFNNPNWFAFCVAPGVFVACDAARRKKMLQSAVLFGLCAAGFILSGSRSVTTLVVASLIILALALLRGRSTEGRMVLVRILCAGLLGAAGSITILFAAFALMGRVALARLVALIDRLFLWPFRLGEDVDTISSIYGRFNISMSGLYGSNVVDNAYLYWLDKNLPAAIGLIWMMLLILALAARNYLNTQSVDRAMVLSIAGFITMAGLLGQVYWAFPVWIILTLPMGYVISSIAFSGFRVHGWRWKK